MCIHKDHEFTELYIPASRLNEVVCKYVYIQIGGGLCVTTRVQTHTSSKFHDVR